MEKYGVSMKSVTLKTRFGFGVNSVPNSSFGRAQMMSVFLKSN